MTCMLSPMRAALQLQLLPLSTPTLMPFRALRRIGAQITDLKMRNLKLIRLQSCHNNQLKNARSFCIDPDKSIIYFLSADNEIWKINSEYTECTFVTSLKEFCKNEETFVSFDFIVVEQILCLGKSSGEIITHNCCNQETEVIDYIESQIKCVSWSPDQELVAFVSGDNSLILKTFDFSTVQVSNIESEDFGDNKPVNVGWGKKETQFHGSVGKAAAKETQQDITPISESDDKKIRVSWREDGLFFAISYITSFGNYRKIRVFSREGIIQYTSDHVPGLEHTLFWQPSGSLISSSVKKPNKHVVTFFEKNCLQHGEFAISKMPQQFKVYEILWNIESNIMAIWLQDLADLYSSHHIQLWTISNYHWHLKQTLNFGDQGLEIRQVNWDTSRSNQLNILCLNGKFISYTWLMTTAFSVGPLEKHNGMVAVIDQNQVKVTPYRHLVVPPPMCAYSCNFERSVNDVLFGPPSKCNEFLVLIGSHTLMHFTDDSSRENGLSEKFITKICTSESIPQNVFSGIVEFINPNTECLPCPLSLMHMVWSNDDELLFTYTTNCKSVLCIATINWNFDTLMHSTDIKSIVLQGEVALMSSNSSGSLTAIQFIDGSFWKYDHAQKVVSSWLNSNQKQLVLDSCIQIIITSIDSKEYIVGFTGKSLHFNDVELASYCTSICVSGEFLIFTTADHQLHCVLKKSLVQGDVKKSLTLTENLRNVERGSRIVTATLGSKVIFQMPRGNLETIYPRPLVLYVINEYLNKLNYKEAIVMMRRHRIDMNLFVDYNSTIFLKNIKTFVEQIDDVDLFNLFLSYLNEENVTETIYNINLPVNSQLKNEILKPKVDLVCNALRKELERQNFSKYFLSILTCYVKMTTPQLETALETIKNLPDVNERDKALDYLHRLVNVDELFNIALGTYDLQLVTIVAEKTQKDPKDYLPFLNELRKLESNFQKFTIDKHLKRYVRALKHISNDNEYFSECMSFIESHHLYSDALKLIPKTSSNYQVLLETYGDYLMKRNLYDEAGVLFFKGKLYEKALEAFKLSGNWRKAFCVAHELNFDEESLKKLGIYSSENLINDRKYVDAAYILENYIEDLEGSIKVLIQGHEWEKVTLMIYKIRKLQLIESLLKPALVDHYQHLSAILNQKSLNFEMYRKRLKLIREQKQAKLMNMNNIDDSDNYSVDDFSDKSSSRSSGMSGSAYTGRTARNKKKQERKRVSLKEGSPFEDVALLEALSHILTETDNLKDECKLLAKSLSLFEFDDEAANLQHVIESLLRMMLSFRSEIWPPKENEANDTLPLGPMTTSNIIAAQSMLRFQARPTPPEFLIYMNPPTLKDVDWKISYLIPSKNA